MHEVYISLGGNVGAVSRYFERATKAISKQVGTITRESSLYRTAPWGYREQQDFLNRVICVSTALDPEAVLGQLLLIEVSMGRHRDRDNRNAPRTIDLDILFYDQLVMTAADLVIPHPRLHLRNFVLVPLMEMVPQLHHPVLGKSIAEIVALGLDDSVVTRL